MKHIFTSKFAFHLKGVQQQRMFIVKLTGFYFLLCLAKINIDFMLDWVIFCLINNILQKMFY